MIRKIYKPYAGSVTKENTSKMIQKTDSEFPNTITHNGVVWYKYKGTTHKVGQMKYHNNKSIFSGERDLIVVDSDLKVI